MTRTLPRLNPLVALLALLLIFALMSDALSQRRGITLVRDAEIEALLQDYSRPLLKAAGMARRGIGIKIVNSEDFNAFVSGNSMFIHTGLLLQAETPNEVIGVIAHEIGHFVGEHQVRLRERVADATRIAKFATLLGVGVAAAGAASGNSDAGAAGFGIASGGSRAALRGLLRYQRDEEQTADRTALRLLRATGQSANGMLATFRRLSRQTSIIAGRIDPYMLSHPTANDRIARLRPLVNSSPYANKRDSASLKLRHDMARAKIAAYLGGSRYGRALLQSGKLHPTAQLYGRAILTYLYGSPRRAIPLIEKVLKAQPRNPYVHEMKGEILLRSNKPKEAIAPFRRAIALDKTKAGFIKVQLGHALLESGQKKNLDEAIRVLTQGVQRDPTALQGYAYLARARAQTGDSAGALLASAELAVRSGKKRQAREYAARAQRGFKRGTPRWLRAQDIIEVR